jgi:tetratricopeptide (TPR) repeat protein
MGSTITTPAELFHRFHTCELYVKQGKIASCLITFKQIIESFNAILLTDKEKKEIHEDIDRFLKDLAAHKKFKEIFGEITFGDTDLNTNLEFVKSLIIAEEQEIVQKINKDEEVSESKRQDAEKTKQDNKEELQHKVDEAIKLIDDGRLTEAMDIISGIDEIRDAVILHFNERGMQLREAKDFTAAVKSYSAALSLSSRDENLHYNLGRVYFEHNQLDKAQEYLHEALEINPDFKEGRLFSDYLLNLIQTREKSAPGAGAEKIAGGLFGKILSFRKLISFQKTLSFRKILSFGKNA